MEKDEKVVEILLVEDLEEDARLIIRSLKKHQLINDIKWVDDGQEALNYLFAEAGYEDRDVRNRPKIIMLDLKLPKINGLVVLERIKSDPRTKSIPVVVMTSSKEDRDIQRAFELGANSYVVKPVDFKQFIDVVKEIGMYWLVLNEGTT